MKTLKIYIGFFLIVLVSCTSLPKIDRYNVGFRGLNYELKQDCTLVDFCYVLQTKFRVENLSNLNSILSCITENLGDNNVSAFFLKYSCQFYFNKDKNFRSYDIYLTPRKNEYSISYLWKFIWNRMWHNQQLITEYDIYDIKAINKIKSDENENMILGSFRFNLGYSLTGRLLFCASELKSKYGDRWIVRKIILPKRNSNNAEDGIVLYDFQIEQDHLIKELHKASEKKLEESSDDDDF